MESIKNYSSELLADSRELLVLTSSHDISFLLYNNNAMRFQGLKNVHLGSLYFRLFYSTYFRQVDQVDLPKP